MKRQFLLILVSLLVTLMFAPGLATACTVNAGAYPTISNALDVLGSGAGITFSGTCAEDVTVTADDVTITGDTIIGSTIEGQLTVDGAQRFVLRDVTVTNSPEIGIFVTDGASAEIQFVTVENASDSGIDVRFGSFARILDSVVQNNMWGLSVNKGGVVDGLRNTISDNAEEQVDLSEHGTYRGTTEEIDQGSGTYAMSVARNSYLNLRSGSTVKGKTGVAIQSHLRLRDDTSVEGDIEVDIQSELDLAGEASVEGDIRAQNLSIVRVLDDAEVNGTVKCVRRSICITE